MVRRMHFSMMSAIIFKIVFALLGFGAIVTEIATLVERDVFNPVNFFSYFTILTNGIVALTFTASAIATAYGKNDKLSELRSAAAVYILTVGIAFAVLLSGLENTTFAAVPWDNIVLHYIIPIAALLDYIFDRPFKTRFQKALVWLIFPFAYLIYTLLRGTSIGWYPYPFLDPMTNGTGAVIMTVAGIILLTLGLTWMIVQFAKPRR